MKIEGISKEKKCIFAQKINYLKYYILKTFSYTLTLEDIELILLKASMDFNKEHYQENFQVYAIAPYWVYKDSANKDLEKLYNNIIKMISNIFFDKK